jgi:Na+-driven multidrug efflux pump
MNKAYAAATIIRIALFAWICVAVAATLLFVPAHMAINWLFPVGPDVREYLTLFLLILPFGFVNGLFREIMPSVDSGKRTTGFVFVSLAIGIVLAVIMIQLVSVKGIFWGIFLSEMVGCVLGWLLLRQIKRTKGLSI